MPGYHTSARRDVDAGSRRCAPTRRSSTRPTCSREKNVGSLPVVDDNGQLARKPARRRPHRVRGPRARPDVHQLSRARSMPFPGQMKHLERELKKIAGATVARRHADRSADGHSRRHPRRRRDVMHDRASTACRSSMTTARSSASSRAPTSSASSPGRPESGRAEMHQPDHDAFRPVWAEVDLEAVRANVARAARGRRAGRGVRGREGRRLRARRGRGEPGRGGGGRRVPRGRARRRRRTAARRRDRRRRSSCSRSRYRPRRRRSSRTGSRRSCTPRPESTRWRRPRCTLGARDPRRRASQGRHRHAPGRLRAGRRGRSRRPCRRSSPSWCSRACARTSRSPTSRGTTTPRRSAVRFEQVLAASAGAGPSDRNVVHACNTAGAIAVPERALRHGAGRHRHLRARTGARARRPSSICVPALSVKARVSHVQTLPAGARLSYGLRYETERATRVATVPIGYADGVPRELPHRGGEVLIGGPAPADRGNGDDGPADGRRRRPRRRRRRRSRADRARRATSSIGAEEWAELMGHDRVHGRVRRRARASRDGTCERGEAGRYRGGRARRVGRRRLRRASVLAAAGCDVRPTAKRAAALEAPVYVDHRLETHDRGTIYVVENGNELDPPIVLSHGVTLSVRTWFHQLEELPKEGFRVDRLRPPRSRAVGARGRGSLARQPRSRPEDGARTARPARRGARRSLDGRRRGAVVRHPVSRDRRGTRRRHRVALDARAHAVRFAVDPHQGAAREGDEARARLAMVVGLAEPRLPRRPHRLRQGPAPEPRRAGAQDDGASARPRPGSTRPGCSSVSTSPRRYPNVHIPTLVIGGTDDVLTPPREARRIARLIPGARLELMRGRRPHAHARTDRRARPPHRRLRALGAGRGRTGRAEGLTVGAGRRPRATMPPVSSFAIAGVRIGHVTRDGTGVTVLLFPSGSVGSGEVRGGAPATREIDVLDPVAHGRARRRDHVRGRLRVRAGGRRRRDALPRRTGPGLRDRGRSGADRAHGLHLRPGRGDRSAADLRRRVRGRGRGRARRAARDRPGRRGRGRDRGQVAGTRRCRSPAAWASRSRASTTSVVGAVAVVNALGDVIGADGRVVAGSTAPADVAGFPTPEPFEEGRANTTLVAVVTDAALDKVACSPGRPERARRHGARAPSGAHALRRRHRDRGRHRHARRRRRSSTACGSRRPTWSRRRFARRLPAGSMRVSPLGVP